MSISPSEPKHQGKLRSRLPLLVALGLMIAGITFTFTSERLYAQQRILTLEIQSDILAASVRAALLFDDAASAQETVNAFRVNPRLEAVAVYNAQGEIVASFVALDVTPLPEFQPARASYVRGNHVHASTPVTEGNSVLGHVYLRAYKEPWFMSFARYASAGLLIVMASMLGFVVLTTQAALRQKNSDLIAANAALQEEMEQRANSEEALRQSQKMEAIGQLTGGVAHDFNNMLAVILSALALIKRRLATGADNVDSLLDSATDGANRAAKLVARLLAFSRQQPLAPEPLDANKFLARMTELLQRTLGEHIRVETVLGAGLWRTYADQTQLENAVLNLAVNARDAMPEGGRLTLETANVLLDDAYAREHGDVRSGQYVMVAVSDTGAGMPQEVIERAFDPFYTTKPAGMGTGLGLSQVFGFVKQSGGHVKIYSELGQGTTMKLYLPRYFGSEAEQAAPAMSKQGPAAPPCEIILVVEDEPRLRDMTVMGLRELGYSVWEASGGGQALDVLDAHPEIQCLFTDIVMPDMNGRQLADEALRRRPGLRVLFTTGYTRNAVVHNGVLDPGLNFLAKPYTLDDLAVRLREVLETKDGGAT